MLEKDEISLKDVIITTVTWLKYIKSKWKIVFICGLMGGFFGLIYFLMKKPIYTARLTFALEEKSTSGALGLSSIASSFGLNLGGGEGGAFAGDNIIELMKSRLLIEKTLLTYTIINGKEDLIINRYITFNKLDEKWAKEPKLSQLKFDSFKKNNHTRTQDSILGYIQNNILKEALEVSKIDKKLSIISVEVKSKDELFAKLFCENLVKNVTDFYVETKTSKSKHNVKLLENRVDSVKRELDQAMYGRASFADQNMSLIRQGAAVPKLKQEIRIQMLGTMYGELVKNLEFSKLALMREEPLIQIIDSPIIPLSVEKPNIISITVIASTLFAFLSIVIIILHNFFTRIILKNNSYV